jgi:hypothetical protein
MRDSISLLTVGTVTPPQNGFLSAPLRGQGSFGINTAGQREDTTNWLVNEINLNDPVQNQITFQPPIDTLAEAKIDNSSFPAVRTKFWRDREHGHPLGNERLSWRSI